MVISLLFSASQKKVWEDCLEVILESQKSIVPLHPLRSVGFARPSLCQHVFWSRPKNPSQQPSTYLYQLPEPQPSVPAHSCSLRIHTYCLERDEGGGPPLLA